MAEFEVERVGGELKRFGVEGSEVPFEVVSPYEPAGSQPKAIESLVQGVRDGDRYQVLLGVTGSGKTFTMAKTIEALGKPTLVMAPNKTLAAQLASELKEFFPNNSVVYFVSYYDYYQPEAYVPQSDTYIEKDSSINEEVEMLRHQATASLLSRRDVIVVASVSCIYGIGSPEDYAGLAPNVMILSMRSSIFNTIAMIMTWRAVRFACVVMSSTCIRPMPSIRCGLSSLAMRSSLSLKSMRSPVRCFVSMRPFPYGRHRIT